MPTETMFGKLWRDMGKLWRDMNRLSFNNLKLQWSLSTCWKISKSTHRGDLVHCTGAQYARRLSCSPWRTISCNQCPWSIDIDVDMWGKSCRCWQLVFGRFGWGWGQILVLGFFWWRVYQLATLNRDAFPFLWPLKRKTWVWRYGFPSFGEHVFFWWGGVVTCS